VADLKPPQAAVVKSHGGERWRKRLGWTESGECQEDERKRTTEDMSKRDSDDVKTRVIFSILGGVRRETAYCSDGVRYGGGVSLTQAFVWNVGTCRLDANGKPQAGRHVRGKVRKRGTGTEQPVVVRKAVKAVGAKGLRHPVLNIGQPEMGGADGQNKAV
jgi:hypothetical protein